MDWCFHKLMITLIIFFWLAALTAHALVSTPTSPYTPPGKANRTRYIPNDPDSPKAEFLTADRAKEILQANPNASIDDILV